MSKEKEIISGTRVQSLDALKFFASMLILFHHFHQCFGQGNMGISFYGGGYIAYGNIVELFFVLSGIFVALQNDKNRNASFSKFMRDKIIRLMPMAALSILCFSVLSILYYYNTNTWWAGIVPDSWNVLKSGLLLFEGGAVLGGTVMPNNPTWYLCVLLICYVWYWLILWLANRIGVNPIYMFIAMVLLGVSIITYGLSLPYLNYASGRGYMSFFFGVVLADVYDTKIKKPSVRTEILSFAVLGLFVAAYCLNAGFFLVNGQNYLFTFLLYPAIIYLFTFSPILKSIFDNSFFGILGEISFEMYIWHSVFYMFITLLDGAGVISFVSSYKTMFGSALIVIVWSIAAFHLLERPITIFLRRCCTNTDN